MPKPPHPEQEIVPRPILIAAGLLVLFVLVGTAYLTWTAEPRQAGPVTDADVTISRDVAFRDEPEGGFSVLDAGEGRRLAYVAPGEGGFIRGVLRSLVRERRQHGAGPDAPFRLTAYSDGRIALHDLATGRLIDVNAFGPTNAQSFASLLLPREDT